MQPKYFIAVILFVMGLLIVDRSIGYLLAKVSPTIKSGASIGEINAGLENDDVDLIIFGSSRAKHHLDPGVMDEMLEMSGYNVSRDGLGIFFARMMQGILLERGNEASYHLMVADPKQVYRADSGRAWALMSHHLKNPVIAELAERSEVERRAKLHSRAYRFNSIVLPILRNLGSSPGFDGNGFLPLQGALKGIPEGVPSYLPDSSVAVVDEEVLKVYREFVRAGVSRGINVSVIVGPRLRKGKRSEMETNAVELIRAAVEESGGVFRLMDEVEYPEFSDASLYRDVAHLNQAGAEMFSRIVAREILAK